MMKGGIKWGVRLAAVTGFYTMTSTISTVYRNKVRGMLLICNQIIKNALNEIADPLANYGGTFWRVQNLPLT